MSRSGLRRRPRWFWALALAILLGQSLGSQAAFAHHARMQLSSSPMLQVCSAQTGLAIKLGNADSTGGGSESVAGSLLLCCSACAVLSGAPAPTRHGLLAPAPDDLAQAAVPRGPVAHERVAALPPARAPPARA